MNDYVTRSPRHESAGATVVIRRSPGGAADSVAARLVNLSRSGFQLRLPIALSEREILVMSLRNHGRGLDVMFPAVVRWCREEHSGTWLAGCQTSWKVDLETLGELFLSEVLVADQA